MSMRNGDSSDQWLLNWALTLSGDPWDDPGGRGGGGGGLLEDPWSGEWRGK